MTAGGVFRVETDGLKGSAVGSVIRMSGTVLGAALSVEEVVTEYRPPASKFWETAGQPRLWVVGGYRMGFALSPRSGGSRLTVFIDYRLPEGGVGRLFGRFLGGSYARWCTRRVLEDAVSSFGVTQENGGPNTAAAWIMGACGVWLIGLGLYFVCLRPALLPEDPRFMGTSMEAIESMVPGLKGWLRNVFIVMGGFMAACGVLVLHLARTVFTFRRNVTTGAFVVTGLLTVALMSAMNFALHSDFRWILLAPVLLWLAGSACLVIRR